MEKRMFSIFLVLCIVLCLLPASTWATVSTDEPGGEQSPVTEITVNDGTEEHDAVPLNNYYNYSVSQYVIPAEDLTALCGKGISDLTYYYHADSDVENERTLRVHFMEGEEFDLSSDFVQLDGATLVFDGTAALKDGQLYIALDEVYAYGGKDLLVTVIDSTGSYITSTYFDGADTGSSRYMRNDMEAYDETNLAGGDPDSFVPKTTIGMVDLISHNITVEETENGTVSAGETAWEGRQVQLTVTPDEGYGLESLTVMQGETEVEVDEDYRFIMPDGDITVKATFAQAESHDITLEATENLTVMAPESAYYTHSVTVTVTPNEGYILESLTVMQGETEVEVTQVDESTFTFRMPTGDVTVKATFMQVESHDITVEATENLTVTAPESAYHTYNVTVTVIPDEGYVLKSLTVMQGETEVEVTQVDETNFAFRMPDGDVTVKATFMQVESHDITVEATENLTVTAPESAYHTHNVTMTVIPDKGYRLKSLTVMQGETEVEVTQVDDTTYTFRMPDGDVVITAIAEEGEMLVLELMDTYGDGWNGNSLSVYLEAADGTETLLQDDITVPSGSEATYTFWVSGTATVIFRWNQGQYAEECSFTVIRDGIVVHEAATGTLNGVETGTMVARSEPWVFREITVEETENGTVLIPETAPEGSNVDLEIIPAFGYKLRSLIVTCGTREIELEDHLDGQYTFTMPAGDVTVIAQFEEDTHVAQHEKDGYELIWYTGFETNESMSGIMRWDEDGDGSNWKWLYEDFGVGHGALTMGSYSWDTNTEEPLVPDNRLITPEFTLEGCYDYQFSLMAQTYGSETLEVFGVFVTTDGGETVTQLGQFENAPAELTEFTFDLSDYVGQTVQLVVRHTQCSDGYLLIVDCLCLYQGINKNANCVDSEKDHICDICQSAVGEHADSDDNDHLCDYGCGEELGHGEKVTYTNHGDTHSATYDCCGADYVTNEAHSYVDGTCVCGAKETVYTITDNLESLSLEGMVRLRQYWGFPGLTREQIEAGNAYMVVTSFGATDFETYTVELIYGGIYNGSPEFYGFTRGIPASRMIKNVTMQAFVVVNGVTYASEVKVCNVLDYCERQFAKPVTAKNEKLKTTLVALLNYGSAAQLAFGHDTNNLLNANMQYYVDTYNLNTTYLELNWNDNYITSLKDPDAEMVGNFVSTGTLIDDGNSLSLEGAIAIRYYYSIGHDNSKFVNSEATMYFWTHERYTELMATNTPLSKENASYVVTDGTLSKYSAKYGYEYDLFSEQIPAAELGNTLYTALCVTDSEGVEHCSGVKAFSPETFAGTKLNDAKLGNVMKWMVVYGERAKENFGK